mgnify:CR=1 FL=1
MKNNKNIKTLKKILSSHNLETKTFKYINKYNNKLIKSLNYWLLAQFNKYFRGDIKNLSDTLKIEFADLQKKWDKKADDFADKISDYIVKHSVVYVNSNLHSQGLKVAKDNNIVKNILKAKIDENLALIKSIPQETILRYKSVLYNQIGNFDLQAINKQIKVISGISKRRARTIARDQVAKIIESYHVAKSQQLGFEYYVWNTIIDERTSYGKGGHKVLNNRIYRYDTPTAIIDTYGNVGKPSDRVNCRCTATALILDINQKLKKIKDSTHGDYYIVV